MRILILLTCILTSTISFGQEQDVPELQKRISENSLYAEILNRTNNIVSGYERATNAHENIHMINAEYSNKKFGKLRAFYMAGERKVFYAKNPKLFKNDIKPMVPNSLRGYRFKTYLEQAQDWNNVPLYILDEWVAYIGGGMVALEDYENGKNRDISDRMCGALEFSIYTVALCMAIEQKDPEFWAQEKEFKGFVQKMLDKSKTVFYKGRYVPDFASATQEKLLLSLKESEDAKPIREFIKKHFNGVFLY